MRKGQYPPHFNVKKAYDNAQMRKRIQQNALLQRIPQGTFVPGRMAQRVQNWKNPSFHRGSTQATVGPRLSASPGRPYVHGHVQLQVPRHVPRPSVHVPIRIPDIPQIPTTNPLMNDYIGVRNPNGSPGRRSTSRSPGRRSRSRSSGRRTSRSPGRRTSRSPSKNKTNKKNGSNKRGVTRTNSNGRRQTWL